jgi:hypothetical protein
MSGLNEIPRFGTDDEFEATLARINELVRRGLLKERGRDLSEMSRIVEVYESPDGEMWRLAVPDHADRGYLKRDEGRDG